MTVYLVQHGKALAKEVDPERPLSPEGVKETETVGDSLAKAGLKIPVIWHSGKTRAYQTAGLLADRLKVDQIEAVSGLAPDDQAADIADVIGKMEQDVLVVGHLPHLSRLASRLIVGVDDVDVIAFVNSGVLRLDGSGGRYRVAWYLTPLFAEFPL